MLYTVIPCRRGEHVAQVIAELRSQDTAVIVVRDRCSVECPGADVVLDSGAGDGFMAGYCRDLGITYALGHGADAVLMVDEDCIPQRDIVAAHSRAVSRDFPVISIGRRLEARLGWKDPREVGEAGNWHLFSGKGSIVQNVSWIRNCLATWSCNLCMNAAAVDVVRRAMERISREPRVFHPAFDGHWGGEDSYLGYLAWAYRVTMAYLPMGANAVKHMDHPRPEPEYGKGFKEVLEAQVDYLRKFTVANPVTLDDITAARRPCCSGSHRAAP
jgi:hypothetical protein